MNYTMSDLLFYGGLIAGMGLGVTLMRQLGFTNNILEIIVGLACGVGLGYVLERMHRGQAPRDDEG